MYLFLKSNKKFLYKLIFSPNLILKVTQDYLFPIIEINSAKFKI